MTRERPILFSAPMVRAILAGTKTQTRRVVKGWPLEWLNDSGFTPEYVAHPENHACPYGQPGDRLWVRETWAVGHNADHLKPSEMDPGGWSVHYAATEDLGGLRKRPGMFMPRWASRITLEVTGVRVERLQGISTADCWAEGISASPDVDPVHEYRDLWESINGPGSWDANPWVWVIEFRRTA